MSRDKKQSIVDFVTWEWPRLAVGVVVGSLAAIALHLVLRDTAFIKTVESKFASLDIQKHFAGASAYKPELVALTGGLVALLAVPGASWCWRYVRSWWAGIISLTGVFAVLGTIVVIGYGQQNAIRAVALALLTLAALLAIEYWRRYIAPARAGGQPDLKLRVPEDTRLATKRWNARTTDEPIDDWSEDMVGRTAVVELLADHVVRLHTPVVALHGEWGDGKSSVLNLLRKTISRRAIVVSFSAWLPGSEATLATDLFRDIANECRKSIYVPQLRKRALAYARTVSASVSVLAGFRELLPQQSQRDEIDELRRALARIPVPIAVLLDDLDRMQREEILVLLKILRGIPSVPNVVFVCAFSEKELTRELSKPGELSYDYLEKFFPVTINLSAPNPELLGRLFLDALMAEFRDHGWFATREEDNKCSDLLDKIWNDALSRVCTNLRKIVLLLNDIRSSGRAITREVNPVDLTVIEAVRRFYPEVYRTIRRNPLYLTYAVSDWPKGRYFTEEEKKKGSERFLKEELGKVVKDTGQSATVFAMLSWIFPDMAAATDDRAIYGISRPTDRETADIEKRICDSDYFPIYFRSAVPEEMFSDAELSVVARQLSEARTESEVESAFSHALKAIPAKHAKRDDFLLKLGRVVETLPDLTAERLAYAAASCAAEYAYDLMNIGEAARALNIVFIVAQKLSKTSAAQRTLLGAIARAADDTFARRIFEYTRDKDRNKILTEFTNVDVEQIRQAFIGRMRQRYGPLNPHPPAIDQVDWFAFRWWVDTSDEDVAVEQAFWRSYIGNSKKRLAKAINFWYPGGTVWSDNPAPIVDKLFPMQEASRLLERLPEEELEQVEAEAIARFRALLRGKYPTSPFDLSQS